MLKSPKPIVLAFGWLGSKQYNMNSFKKIYNSIGLDYKSMIQSYFSVLNIAKDDKKFNEMYEAAKGRNVLCHIFSLNGASSFLDSLMKKDLSAYKEGIKVKGIIWDSSPGFSPDYIYHTAFAKSLFPKNEMMARVTARVLKPAFNIFLKHYKGHKDRSDYIINHIYKSPLTCPQLILGSKRDHVIKYEDTLAYAEAAKKAGADVKTRFWDDSEHVSLYHDHKQEYIGLVKDFAEKYLIDAM